MILEVENDCIFRTKQKNGEGLLDEEAKSTLAGSI
jgi:hypothetical protein